MLTFAPLFLNTVAGTPKNVLGPRGIIDNCPLTTDNKGQAKHKHIPSFPQTNMRRNEEQYRTMIKRIKGASLLALPQSAVKVFELSKDERNGPKEFAAVITPDLGLTSQILRFVNSAFFGFRNKVTTVQMALSLVYGRTIKNFVLWNAVFAQMPNPQCGPFDLKKIFQDSLRRGLFARILTPYCPGNLDPEELFLCALFQDMAIPILAQTWPKEYEEILARRQKEKRRLSVLENETFGWNHADAGGFLVNAWGFTDDFVDVIVEHIEQDDDIDIKTCDPHQLRRAIVALAGLLPSVVDEKWDDADAFFNLYSRFIQPELPSVNVVFEQIERQMPELAAIAHLGPVTDSLPKFHQQWLQTLEQ